MDIKCRKTTCTFNKGHTCCSCKVDITKNAVCKTFEKEEQKDDDNFDLSKKMFEVAPSYSNSRHIKNLLLECDAQKCLFNKNGKCRANGITVLDQNDQTQCGTFLCDLNWFFVLQKNSA